MSSDWSCDVPTERDELPAHLLEAFCAGSATLTQQAEIDAWFAKFPRERAWYEQLREGLRSESYRSEIPFMFIPDTNTILGRIRGGSAHTDARRGSPVTPYNQRGSSIAEESTDRRSRLLRGKGTTASVRLGAGIGATVLLGMIGWISGIFTTRSSVDRPEMTDASFVYTTANGQRSAITLPDGSIVTLNVGSRLEVPAAFSLKQRVLYLTGEAMFTVTHDSKGPFTVITPYATTRVLGTRFVVRHYGSDTTTTIAVDEGRVAVNGRRTTPIVVSGGEEIAVGPLQYSARRSVLSSRFGFADGILSINGRMLGEVIPELNRWYDTDLKLGDPALARLRVTIENASGSISDLVTTLEWTFNLRVDRQGRTLTLYPGN